MLAMSSRRANPGGAQEISRPPPKLQVMDLVAPSVLRTGKPMADKQTCAAGVDVGTEARGADAVAGPYADSSLVERHLSDLGRFVESAARHGAVLSLFT